VWIISKDISWVIK